MNAPPPRSRSVARTTTPAGARGRLTAALGSLAAVLVLLACLPAGAAADTPPTPPGPPPGNGGDLPAPPGTAPTFVPPGTAAVLPDAVTGAGRLGNGAIGLNSKKGTFAFPFACQANGTIQINAKSAASAPLARAPFKCQSNRATAHLTVTPKLTKVLTKQRSVAATATIKQAGRSSKLYFTLRVGASAVQTKDFWTDGHLQCTDSAGAPQAYLVEPDFTTEATTPISTRGWIAWYSAAGGWHWLGLNGENNSRWDTWTASPTGIVQFHPAGSPVPTPWTWGPISIPVGKGIAVIGVYEIVYWVGGNPSYQWQYVNAGSTGAAAAGGGNLYCNY